MTVKEFLEACKKFFSTVKEIDRVHREVAKIAPKPPTRTEYLKAKYGPKVREVLVELVPPGGQPIYSNITEDEHQAKVETERWLDEKPRNVFVKDSTGRVITITSPAKDQRIAQILSGSSDDKHRGHFAEMWR